MFPLGASLRQSTLSHMGKRHGNSRATHGGTMRRHRRGLKIRNAQMKREKAVALSRSHRSSPMRHKSEDPFEPEGPVASTWRNLLAEHSDRSRILPSGAEFPPLGWIWSQRPTPARAQPDGRTPELTVRRGSWPVPPFPDSDPEGPRLARRPFFRIHPYRGVDDPKSRRPAPVQSSGSEPQL